jgi:hypothetical protein
LNDWVLHRQVDFRDVVDLCYETSSDHDLADPDLSQYGNSDSEPSGVLHYFPPGHHSCGSGSAAPAGQLLPPAAHTTQLLGFGGGCGTRASGAETLPPLQACTECVLSTHSGAAQALPGSSEREPGEGYHFECRCSARFHLRCLAAAFQDKIPLLSVKAVELMMRHGANGSPVAVGGVGLMPQSGSCPACGERYTWGQVVRAVTDRRREQAIAAAPPRKARRRPRRAAGSVEETAPEHSCSARISGESREGKASKGGEQERTSGTKRLRGGRGAKSLMAGRGLSAAMSPITEDLHHHDALRRLNHSIKQSKDPGSYWWESEPEPGSE